MVLIFSRKTIPAIENDRDVGGSDWRWDDSGDQEASRSEEAENDRREAVPPHRA